MTNPFDRPDLLPLWRALWERYSEGRPVSRVRVGPLDYTQRSALADLLGRIDLPDEHVFVSVPALDRILVAAMGQDARQVTEMVCGDLRDRASERSAMRAVRDELWSWFENHPIIRQEPALAGWAANVRSSGIIGDASSTRSLLERAFAVLAGLPADGSSLPAFAAKTCGDPHALDEGSRLAALVLKGLAAIYDEPIPLDAEQRRALWARAGVACDALSTFVLVAGLRPCGDDPLSTTLRTWAESGQAASVTLAQLQSCPPLLLSAPTVWAVENPSVLAAALSRFGARCPALICVSGWPSTAAILLLRQINIAGSHIWYHGDFDGDGLRIAAYVIGKTGAVPWRMST